MHTKNQLNTFQLTSIQAAYLMGRSSQFPYGGVSTYIYSENQYKKLDIEKLEKALNYLIKRHISFRTFFLENAQCYVEEIPYYEVKLNRLSTLEDLCKVREKLSQSVLNKSKPPLFSFEVSFIEKDDVYILHSGLDYLIIDGSSTTIFFKELATLYQNLNLRLPELKKSFKDYVLRLDNKSAKAYNIRKKYWSKKIYDYNLDINLPVNEFNCKKKHKFNSLTSYIHKNKWDEIKKIAKLYEVTPTQMLITAYGLMLCKYSNQENISINITISNRPMADPEMENVIGEFTSLFLLNFKKDNYSFINLCKYVQQELQNHRNDVFDGIAVQQLIRKQFQIPYDKLIAPIVFTGFRKDRLYPILDDDYLGTVYQVSQTPQVWLDCMVNEVENGDLLIWWNYVEELFNNHAITSMHNTYCKFIEELTNINNISWYYEIKLPRIDQNVIKIANSASQDLSNKNLITKFEQLVLKNPELEDQVCAIDSWSDTSYKYKNLIEDSEILARFLFNYYRVNLQNYTSRELIAVLYEKGYNQILSCVSIMKAGYGYLPLHVDWPLDRIREILDQSNVKLLITSHGQKVKKLLKGLKDKYNLVTIKSALTEGKELNKNIELPMVKPDDIAYVIYTSGTTGKPKGVTISHKSALNTIDAVNREFKVTSKDKILALSELSFDLSVYDIFGLLAVGGSIIFPEQTKIKNPEYWLEIINKYQITIWNSVPQLANLLIEAAENSDLYIAYLRLFLLSGDWIPPELPNKITNYCHNAQVISLGGATEGSIWSIWYTILENKNLDKIPYGFPMPNQKMYVLDLDCNHCPIGVTGEIYIGGVGIALNYYNDEKMTNFSFINHPILGRLYKTGDLGKWHKNGYIEFLGRKDNQVKINGYRVELEEISSNLNKIPGINKAIVIVQKVNGTNNLVGYLLPNKIKGIIQDEFDSSNNRLKFQLKLLGIRSDLSSTYELNIIKDISSYFLYKSYRNFENKLLDKKQLIKICKKVNKNISNIFSNNLKSSKKFTQENLIEMLGNISCIRLQNRSFPKYLYPSAGGTYSVRCYINFNQAFASFNPGYYYYNPLTNCLYEIADIENFSIKIDKNASVSIDFIVYWPAIDPIYSTESRRFAFLEAGHMLGLLLNCLHLKDIFYEVELVENEINAESTHVLRIVIKNNFETHKKQNKRKQFGNTTLDILLKNKNSIYFSEETKVDLQQKQENVFLQSQQNIGGLLENGRALLAIGGDESVSNFIYAGMWAQLISKEFLRCNIGSCMLGVPIYDGIIYTIVLGSITEKEKQTLDSIPKAKPLRKIINDKLSLILPKYMIPQDYIMLNRVPITTNGKLDTTKLPLLKLANKKTYVAPKTDVEGVICKIFASILHLPIKQVGVYDSFFRLGGNSFLAMQCVNLINKKFKMRMNISYLYSCKCAKELAQHLKIHSDESSVKIIL